MQDEQTARATLDAIERQMRMDDSNEHGVNQRGRLLLQGLRETKRLVKTLTETLPVSLLTVTVAQRKTAYDAFCTTVLALEQVWQSAWRRLAGEGEKQTAGWQEASCCVEIAQRYPSLKNRAEGLLAHLQERQNRKKDEASAEQALGHAWLAFWDGAYKAFLEKAALASDAEHQGRQMRVDALKQLCLGLSVAVEQTDGEIECILLDLSKP